MTTVSVWQIMYASIQPSFAWHDYLHSESYAHILMHLCSFLSNDSILIHCFCLGNMIMNLLDSHVSNLLCHAIAYVLNFSCSKYDHASCHAIASMINNGLCFCLDLNAPNLFYFHVFQSFTAPCICNMTCLKFVLILMCFAFVLINMILHRCLASILT